MHNVSQLQGINHFYYNAVYARALFGKPVQKINEKKRNEARETKKSSE